MKEFLRRFLTAKSLPIYLAVIAIALVFPSVWTGWQQDDLVHRYFFLGNPSSGAGFSPLDMFSFIDGDSSHTLALMDVGVVPWWTLPTVRLSFWRPLAALTHWLDYLIWPQSSVLMHVQSLFWFGAMVIAAAFVYRRFLGATWVAGLAALFFALDDTHGLAAGWIANRNALIAGFFGLLVLIVHDRWRRGNWGPGAYVGPVTLLLGLLSGESALAVCGYLVGYVLFMDAGSRRERALTMLPYAFITATWLITYDMLGYGTWGSGFYVDPLSEPLRFLMAIVWKGPLLFADQWALPPSSIVLFLTERLLPVFWVWGLIVLALVAVLIVPLVRRDHTARFWFTGMLLSIPLVCSTKPHSRLLVFAGIGAFGLLAQWVRGVVGREEWIPGKKWWSVMAPPMLVFFLIVHTIVAALLLPFDATSAAFGQAYIQDPAGRVAAGPEFETQDLVILNHPIVFYAHSFATARILAGQPAPRRMRVLAPASVPLRIYRSDDCTLVVRPEGGFLGLPFDDVFRDPVHLMRKGDHVSLTGMTVEVMDVTDDGRPAEAAFRFSVSLDDMSLRWLQWEKGGYALFRPPPVGESTITVASPLPF